MHVIHGTWIPDDSPEFIQRGAFYLWVETDTIPDASWRPGDTIHPRHLAGTALTSFLMERLGLRDSLSGILESTFCWKYFLLPTVEGKPAPSFELLRYVDEETPTEFDLLPWRVRC